MRGSAGGPLRHPAPSSPKFRRGPARAPALAVTLPALTAAALGARTLGYAFVWDDLDLIVRNAALQGPAWAALLVQDFWQSTGGGTGMWRPLVTLSFRVDGMLSGWQPWAFHLVNVGLHAGSTALVAWLALGTGAPPLLAALAGLVVATAPALGESTAWIAGRADGLVALSTLGALALARARRARARPWAALGVGACAALALAAKESAIVLPLLLAADAVDARATGPAAGAPARAAAGEIPGRAWAAAWPALPALAAWAIAHAALVASPANAADPGAAGGMAALVWAHLAWLAPWAAHSPLLDLWQPPGTVASTLAWAALAGVLVVAGLCARRRVPLLLPLALVFLPLAPVAAASLVESGVRFAERSLALPVAGLALALAWLLGRPRVPRVLGAGALAAWVLAQAIAAWPALGAWRNEESRIRRVAEVRPRDPDALLGLADLLASEGRDDEARDWIARAEAVSPDATAPLVARASLAFRGGRTSEALAFAERALERAPGDLAAGVLRVRALARLGRAAEAVEAAETLVRAHPGDPAARGALGVARFAAGDAPGALPELRFGSDRLLDDAGLAWDLGRAAIALAQVELARAAFERAVTAAPAWSEGWLAVADTRSRLGEMAGAEHALARARALGADAQRLEAVRALIRARSEGRSLPDTSGRR